METQTTPIVKDFNSIPGVTANSNSVKRHRAPSAKRAQTKAQKEVARGFPLPLSLTCTKTGKVNKYTSLAYIRKLIERAGTLENLRKTYVSAEARKQPKQ